MTNTQNSVLFTNTKVYSLTLFNVVVWERGTEYENRVDRVCWTNRNNLSWGEKDRPWTIFPVSCCSSSALVRCFHRHTCASGVRPLLGAQPQNGPRNFRVFTSSLAGLQLSSLPRYVSQSTNSFLVSYLTLTTLTAFSLEFQSEHVVDLLLIRFHF